MTVKVRHGSPYPLGATWDESGVNVEHAYASINFVTSHDGFTLHDLVICNEKHNEANGENNCYGADVDNGGGVLERGDEQRCAAVWRERARQHGRGGGESAANARAAVFAEHHGSSAGGGGFRASTRR